MVRYWLLTIYKQGRNIYRDSFCSQGIGCKDLLACWDNLETLEPPSRSQDDTYQWSEDGCESDQTYYPEPPHPQEENQVNNYRATAWQIGTYDPVPTYLGLLGPPHHQQYYSPMWELSGLVKGIFYSVGVWLWCCAKEVIFSKAHISKALLKGVTSVCSSPVYTGAQDRAQVLDSGAAP